jgi:hypothetical protein
LKREATRPKTRQLAVRAKRRFRVKRLDIGE